jgi:hypothetical protein
MAYGIESRLFLGNDAERASLARSASTARTWRALNAASRLELIERALERPANDDMPNGLPVALQAKKG